MTDCRELSEYSVKITQKNVQAFREINDAIFLVYENEVNKRNYLPFQTHSKKSLFVFGTCVSVKSIFK